MAGWIDPKEQSPEAWGRTDDREEREPDPTPGPMEGTLERALETTLPYRYSEVLRYDGVFPTLEVGPSYTSGRVVVDGGVTGDRHLKLLARGYLWSDDSSVRNGQRFKLLFRRPGPPTETTPFGTYHVWYRHQVGTVHDGSDLSFDPTDEPRTQRPDVAFEAVPLPLCHHIAKLELVRNPPFARYVLEERDEWVTYDHSFRWDPDAFE